MRRVVLICAAAYSLLYLSLWLARGDSPRFGDFFALWTFGRFALSHAPAAIYDQLALQSFQRGLDPAFTEAYPFLYPPSFLLLALPLGLLPLAASWGAWTAAGLVLYVSAASERWRSITTVAILVLPTTLLAVVAGQSGLLTATLLLGGLRVVPRRPWLGGVVLGLLVIKPQLAVLVPVALMAARCWRSLLAAAVAAAAVLGASAVLLGTEVWMVWLRTLPATTQLVLDNRAAVARIMPTVSAGLFELGVPDGVAHVLQLAASVAAGVMVWRACRPGLTPRGVAVLALATFLATPYGYIYDLPGVGGGLVLMGLPRHRKTLLLAAAILVVPLAMLRIALPLVEPLLMAAMIAALMSPTLGETATACQDGIHREPARSGAPPEDRPTC